MGVLVMCGRFYCKGIILIDTMISMMIISILINIAYEKINLNVQTVSAQAKQMTQIINGITIIESSFDSSHDLLALCKQTIENKVFYYICGKEN